MKTIGKIAFAVSVLAASALAQNRLQSGPPTAGLGPSYDVNFGYTFLTSTIPSAGRVNLNGLDAGARVDFSPHWGAMVDSGYVRTTDVLGTGHNGFDLTFLAGPVFYPMVHRNTRLMAYGLAGAALVDSAVPVTGSNYLGGWVARPSYALGGGIEQSVKGPFAIRVTGDYLRTAYIDSTATVQRQNNLRITTAIVFRLHDGGTR